MKENEIFAITGANGSGKSTLINMIAGNLAASRGNVIINGLLLAENQDEINESMGFCPDAEALEGYFTLRAAIENVAWIKGILEKEE